MFKRRSKPKVMNQVTRMIWPNGGWRRYFQYQWLRLKRLNSSPERIARGFACGVAASFTPFVGLHLLICFAAAFFVRGSFIASAVGTLVGNPLTFPIIWITSYKVGAKLFDLGTGVAEADIAGADFNIWNHLGNVDTLITVWQTKLLPMVVGGLPLGVLFGLLFYFPVKSAVSRYQARRQQRLSERAKAVAAAQSAKLASLAEKGDIQPSVSLNPAD